MYPKYTVTARLEVKSLLTRKDFKPALTNWQEVVRQHKGSFFTAVTGQLMPIFPSQTQQEAIRLNAIDLHYRLTEAQETSPGLWVRVFGLLVMYPRLLIIAHVAYDALLRNTARRLSIT